MSVGASPPPAAADGRVPRHIAIVMDGNGRWAEARHRPRSFGHKAGVDAVRAVVESCLKRGIEVLTLFAFSSENWRRPQQEVSTLMDLPGQEMQGTGLQNSRGVRELQDESLLENGAAICRIPSRQSESDVPDFGFVRWVEERRRTKLGHETRAVTANEGQLAVRLPRPGAQREKLIEAG